MPQETKLKIAYPILLVVFGLLVSFVPGLPVVKVDPDLIFFIFLCLAFMFLRVSVQPRTAHLEEMLFSVLEV